MNPFGIAAGHLNRVATSAALGAMRGGVAGGALRAGAWGARGMGAYMGGLARGNPTVWGATLGGAWGMASDDTSVLGGAAIGASAGRYGAAGWRLADRAARIGGINTFRGSSAAIWRGMRNQGQADWRMAWGQGRSAATYIGRTSRRGYNSFKGLFA